MMKKIIKGLLVLIFGLTIFNTNINADDLDNTNRINLNSKEAIVYNLNNNQIMYATGKDEKIYPASLTKMMSALVVIEEVKDLDQEVVISKEALDGLAENNASVAGFSENEVVTYRDLLYGMLLESGGDACNQVALSVFSSDTKMVKAMNDKCKELKMDDTHFANTTGLHDNNNYSTVYDLTLLLKAGLENKTFKTIITSSSYTTSDKKLTFNSTFANRKSLIEGSGFIKGGKTGFTNEAGLCLASYASQNDIEYLVIVANAGDDLLTNKAMEDTYNLLKYYYDNYVLKTVYKKGEQLTKIKISNGNRDTYKIITKKDIKLVLAKEEDEKKVKCELVGSNKIIAPLSTGTYLGELTYTYENKILKEESYYLEENIDQSFFSLIGDFFAGNIIYLIGIVVVIILIILLIRRNKDKQHRSSYANRHLRNGTRRRFK